MHSDNEFSKLVQYIPLLLVAGCLYIFRYDFSRSNLWFYDFLVINENVLWFLLAITFVSTLLAWRHDGLGLPSLIMFVLLFSVVEVAANYPMIWRDVYLQGSASKAILEKGHVAGTWNMYPMNYPGFFLLWSMTTLVTGLDLFLSNILLLLPLAMVLLILILSTFYSRLSLRKRYANAVALLAFLLMNFNTNEFTFVHFNTRLLSLLHALLFLLLLLMKSNSRARTVALLVTYASMVISHAINSVVPIIFLVMHFLFERRRIHPKFSLFLCCALTYATWATHVSFTILSEGIARSLGYARLIISLQIISAWSPTMAKPQPFFGVALSTYYKLLLIALSVLSMYSAIRLRRKRNVRFLAAYLLGVLMLYGASFFALADIAVNRGIILASVPLAGLPIMLCRSVTGKHANHGLKRKVLVALIVVLAIPQFILLHQLPLARYQRVGSIDATMNFVLDHRNEKPVASLGDFPVYYCFYEPFFNDYHNFGFNDYPGWDSLDSIVTFFDTSPNESLKMLDYRKIVDWGAILGHSSSYNQALDKWHLEVYARLDQRYNRIYSTAFETIHV